MRIQGPLELKRNFCALSARGHTSDNDFNNASNPKAHLDIVVRGILHP